MHSSSALQLLDLAGTEAKKTITESEESLRDTTTITYGTGKITGDYMKDNLCLGEKNCAKVAFLV